LAKTKAPKAPQDHKPKQADKPTAFAFTIGEEDFTLPFVGAEIVNRVEGRIVEAAMLDGEEGQAKMAFALLRAVPDHDKDKEALRSLPFPEMLTYLLDWLKASGVSLGESAG
jgi:hypothetical protein